LRLTNNRNVLPDIETGVNARRYALYHNLPNEFDKSVYDRIVSEMNENASTAYKWINKFIQDGRLKRTSKGNYVKS
jgi:predicted transcriptional regulator